jgi:hypothetical protein
MPHALAERLEGLSAYRIIFPPHDHRAALNPVAYSHMEVMIGGTAFHVLSRVGFAGLDYTGRSNKLAHHVVLEPSELSRGGPAWLLDQPGFLQESWNGEVGFLTDRRNVPQGDVRPGICEAWQAATGDAGWAGVIAQAFLADPKKPVYVVYEPGQNLLALVAEIVALLPSDRRWDVTFSTYFTTVPQGVACGWRGVVRGSPEAKAVRTTQALVLDLAYVLGTAPDGPLVEQARTGQPPASLPPTIPPLLAPERASPPAEAIPSVRTTHVPSAAVLNVPPMLRTSCTIPPSVPSKTLPTPVRRKRRRTAIVVGACGIALLLGGLLVSQLARSSREEKPDADRLVARNEHPPSQVELDAGRRSLQPSTPNREVLPAAPTLEPKSGEKASDETTREAIEPEPRSAVPVEPPRRAQMIAEPIAPPEASEPVPPPIPAQIEFVRSSCELPPANGFVQSCDLFKLGCPSGGRAKRLPPPLAGRRGQRHSENVPSVIACRIAICTGLRPLRARNRSRAEERQTCRGRSTRGVSERIIDS